jgi:hypothetical protein
MILEIIFYFLTLVVAIVWFFMKVTFKDSTLIELILNAFSKLIGVFIIGYSVIKLFKFAGVL